MLQGHSEYLLGQKMIYFGSPELSEDESFCETGNRIEFQFDLDYSAFPALSEKRTGLYFDWHDSSE